MTTNTPISALFFDKFLIYSTIVSLMVTVQIPAELRSCSSRNGILVHCAGVGDQFNNPVKGTQKQAWISETESLWTQEPVTRDFLKSYSIRLWYSTFKHFCGCSASIEIVSSYAKLAIKLFPPMLSKRWNHFLVCSPSGEIVSAYAQPAMKSVPPLTQHAFGWSCKTVQIWTLAEHVRNFSVRWKSFPRMLSKRRNPFRVCLASACYNFRKVPQNPKIKMQFSSINNQNFDNRQGSHLIKKEKFWNMTFMIGNRILYVGLLPFPLTCDGTRNMEAGPLFRLIYRHARTLWRTLRYGEKLSDIVMQLNFC